jgi:hypothetical protein
MSPDGGAEQRPSDTVEQSNHQVLVSPWGVGSNILTRFVPPVGDWCYEA